MGCLFSATASFFRNYSLEPFFYLSYQVRGQLVTYRLTLTAIGVLLSSPLLTLSLAGAVDGDYLRRKKSSGPLGTTSAEAPIITGKPTGRAIPSMDASLA